MVKPLCILQKLIYECCLNDVGISFYFRWKLLTQTLGLLNKKIKKIEKIKIKLFMSRKWFRTASGKTLALMTVFPVSKQTKMTKGYLKNDAKRDRSSLVTRKYWDNCENQREVFRRVSRIRESSERFQTKLKSLTFPRICKFKIKKKFVENR